MFATIYGIEYFWTPITLRRLCSSETIEQVGGSPEFHVGFFGGGKKFVGHCHSVMHEYETIQILKFSGEKN